MQKPLGKTLCTRFIAALLYIFAAPQNLLRRPQLVPVATGQNAVVADFEIAARQHVHEKPPNKLKNIKRRLLQFAALAIVLPLEINPIILHFDKPVIGNSHPMAVAAQVLQHLLDVSVARGGFEIGVTKQLFDGQKVNALLQQVGGKTVAQSMN